MGQMQRSLCLNSIARIMLWFDGGLRLSDIRREGTAALGILRTGLEHLRPIEVGLLGRVALCEHGHAALCGRNVVVGQLGVNVGRHVVGHIVAVRLVGGRTHDRIGHVSPVTVRVIEPIHAARPRKLGLLVGNVVHPIGTRNKAKRNDSIAGHVSHTIHLVNIALATESILLGSSVLLDVRLGVGEVASTGRVTATN